MRPDFISSLLQFMGSICGIIAFIWIHGVNKRLTKIENDLEKLKQ